MRNCNRGRRSGKEIIRKSCSQKKISDVRPFFYRCFRFWRFTPRLPSENGEFRSHNTKSSKTVFLPMLPFLAICSPFTFGKRGISGRTIRKAVRPFFYRCFRFWRFAPRLPSENGGIQVAQHEKQVRPIQDAAIVFLQSRESCRA